MRNSKKIGLLLFLVLLFTTKGTCQQFVDASGKIINQTIVIENNDTLYSRVLPTLYVFPPMKFKNKSQEKFYWKTVRDVKKALPYARIVSRTLNSANEQLAKLPNDDARKAYLKSLENEVKKRYEPDLREMTFSQGKMLIKLINRETNYTSYDLIKMYRGTFAAFFWQGVAKLFGTDLKAEYDGNDKEKIIERVIILVEAGQL